MISTPEQWWQKLKAGNDPARLLLGLRRGLQARAAHKMDNTKNLNKVKPESRPEHWAPAMADRKRSDLVITNLKLIFYY